MFRYYISFSHQAPMGLGISSLDISTQLRISNVDRVCCTDR